MEQDPTVGAFMQSLTKSNQKIREGRAASIAEDLHMQYRRTVEDMEHKLREYRRDLADMLDLHPDSAFGLRIASDFKANDFVAQRMELRVKIHNLKIRLKLAHADFNALFDSDGDAAETINAVGAYEGAVTDTSEDSDELDVDHDPID